MTAHAFFVSHCRVKCALSAFLSFLLLLPTLTVFAHPLPQTVSQARPALSPPSAPAPRPQSLSELKVGDIIRARSNATGKVEWKQVIHASRRTVPSLLSIHLINIKTHQQAEPLVCPLDEPVRLTDGRTIPAGHLAVGKSIIPRAGPACKVTAMFLLRKPGGFLLCDVRIGPLSAAQRQRLASTQPEQAQPHPLLGASFAGYQYTDPALAYAGYAAAASSGGTVNPFLFQGQQFDPASNDYYLRARYYDPTMGRFLSQDPFAGVDTNPLSLHRYLYTSGDPVNYADPTGLEGEIAEEEAGLAVTGELAPVELEASGTNTLANLNATFGGPSGLAGTATPQVFRLLGGVALRRAALVVGGSFLASILASDLAGSPTATEQVYEDNNPNDFIGFHYTNTSPSAFIGTGLRPGNYITNAGELSPQAARSILIAHGPALQYRYTVAVSLNDPLYPLQPNNSPLGIDSTGPIYEYGLPNGSAQGSVIESATYNNTTYQ